MGQGIQDFYTVAQSQGFARDYQLRIAQIGDLFQTPNDNIFVYARTATVPKRTIQTVDVNFKGFKYIVPMQAQYEGSAWPLKIYCDEAYNIRAAFELWQKQIFNEHTMQGKLENKMIQLNLLNDKTDTVMIYRLHGVMPQSIGDISYDLGGNGAPQSFEISFIYQYWTSESVSIRHKEDVGLLGRITNVIRGANVVGQNVNNVVKGVRNVSSILGSRP